MLGTVILNSKYIPSDFPKFPLRLIHYFKNTSCSGFFQQFVLWNLFWDPYITIYNSPAGSRWISHVSRSGIPLEIPSLLFRFSAQPISELFTVEVWDSSQYSMPAWGSCGYNINIDTSKVHTLLYYQLHIEWFWGKFMLRKKLLNRIYEKLDKFILFMHLCYNFVVKVIFTYLKLLYRYYKLPIMMPSSYLTKNAYCWSRDIYLSRLHICKYRIDFRNCSTFSYMSSYALWNSAICHIWYPRTVYFTGMYVVREFCSESLPWNT